ncbi:MAG: DUF3263 domain-containing protein [Propionibacteriales bacterium]|nr:DUF3263 domain-containing protein [Propionibacteriales bacterium]
MADLTDEHRAMLDFERVHWRYPAGKESEVRERFGLSLSTYQKRLNALLDEPAAVQYAPSTVRRLRRLRQKRIAARRQSRTSA